MFSHESFRHGDVNDVIKDAEGEWEGRHRCTGWLIWDHVRADLGSRELAVMGLESQTVSARETAF